MEYAVNIYLNGIYWDSSYTKDIYEAKKWKTDFENKNVSIWDRLNGAVLEEFIEKFHIIDAENIEVTVEIEVII